MDPNDINTDSDEGFDFGDGIEGLDTEQVSGIDLTSDDVDLELSNNNISSEVVSRGGSVSPEVNQLSSSEVDTENATPAVSNTRNASSFGIELKDVKSAGSPADQIKYLQEKGLEKGFKAVSVFESNDIEIVQKKSRAGKPGIIHWLRKTGSEYKLVNDSEVVTITLENARNFLTSGSYLAFMIKVTEELNKEYNIKFKFTEGTIKFEDGGQLKDLRGSKFEADNSSSLSMIYGKVALGLLDKIDKDEKLKDSIKMYCIDYKGEKFFFRVNSENKLQILDPEKKTSPNTDTGKSDWVLLSSEVWEQYLDELVNG